MSESRKDVRIETGNQRESVINPEAQITAIAYKTLVPLP